MSQNLKQPLNTKVYTRKERPISFWMSKTPLHEGREHEGLKPYPSPAAQLNYYWVWIETRKEWIQSPTAEGKKGSWRLLQSLERGNGSTRASMQMGTRGFFPSFLRCPRAARKETNDQKRSEEAHRPVLGFRKLQRRRRLNWTPPVLTTDRNSPVSEGNKGKKNQHNFE